MTEAVIVSTARTPIGKAYRGALNNTEGPTMAGHVIGEAVRRAKVEPGEVEDVVMGCAMQQGTTAMNVARKGAIRAGLPVIVAGTTIDRQYYRVDGLARRSYSNAKHLPGDGGSAVPLSAVDSSAPAASRSGQDLYRASIGLRSLVSIDSIIAASSLLPRRRLSPALASMAARVGVGNRHRGAGSESRPATTTMATTERSLNAEGGVTRKDRTSSLRCHPARSALQARAGQPLPA